MVKTGTWRKRGALKLKRKYDRLKRELNASRRPVVAKQVAGVERVTATGVLPIGIRGGSLGVARYMMHDLAMKIADSLLDADAIRFECEGSQICGRPVVRATLDFVRREL